MERKVIMPEKYYIIPHNNQLRIWREGDFDDYFDVIEKDELLHHMKKTLGLYMFGDPKE